jgi:oligopeptide/dipeptide ABC transporter ATP-binding protein
MSLLELEGVSKEFEIGGGRRVYAVNSVDLHLDRGRTVAVIGESGSGKSTLGRIALRLLEPTSGTVRFDGRDLGALDRAEMRRLRSRMQVVFQEPFESLNPRMSIGEIVGEPLLVHSKLTKAARRAKVLEVLEHVGLGGGDLARRYPGELSGGQQQRVGVARAIVTEPSLLVLDEPTSSLDVSIRAQILALLQRLQAELDLAYLFISHDIQTVRYLSNAIIVMYQGTVVESGPSEAVFAAPRHPYTQALLASAMSPDPDDQVPTLQLQGDPPTPTTRPQGCVFRGRCPVRIAACDGDVPLVSVGGQHSVACVNLPGADRLARETFASAART